MNGKEFNDIVEETIASVRQTLLAKTDEYVPADSGTRFHNFEVAASLNNQRSTEALWGFLTKHLVSLSDMVKVDSTDEDLARWAEKINDSIIYLILLYGIVTENDQNKTSKELINVDAVQ